MSNARNLTRMEEESFVVDLMHAAVTHEKWLVFMRFGLQTLLQNQPLFMELIVIEAQKQATRDGQDWIHAADTVRGILDELGLRLVVA